jgi:hypothetical protein
MRSNEEAVARESARALATDDGVEHDLRGAFALQYALTEVIKGLASLSNDQLDECLSRMWEADRLASEMDAWIGPILIIVGCGSMMLTPFASRRT